MSFYGQIYKITYPDDPHYYYGQTTIPLSDRLQEHVRGAERGLNYDLSKWILLLENTYLLQIEMIDEAFNEEVLNHLEEEIIGDLWYTDPYCLNMIPGGNSAVSKNRATGENHGNAKLSDQEVQEARKLWLTGDYTIKDLTQKFGGGSTTMGAIVKNLTRKDPDYLYEPGAHGARNQHSKKDSQAEYRMVRLFAQDHPDWSGASIARELGINGKHCRVILRNQKYTYDPNWDPETWTYTS